MKVEEVSIKENGYTPASKIYGRPQIKLRRPCTGPSLLKFDPSLEKYEDAPVDDGSKLMKRGFTLLVYQTGLVSIFEKSEEHSGNSIAATNAAAKIVSGSQRKIWKDTIKNTREERFSVANNGEKDKRPMRMSHIGECSKEHFTSPFFFRSRTFYIANIHNVNTDRPVDSRLL
ncbi:BnaA05g25930D [Brassica napus]|uniref:BnaA05g25930D protein n=2 Tax=Brassica TaxID=3705 RepID=A0A078I4F5_BRANA|nr:BnaA05g25930D [Brassica napus]